MKELMALYEKDIKQEGFTKKEIVIYNAVAVGMVVAALIGGSLLG